MGFNLSGYLVKGKVNNLSSFLEPAMGRRVARTTITDFENASRSKYDPDHVDVYETPSGYFILCDYELISEKAAKLLSKGTEVLTFRMSETSMAFMFEKYANEKLIWEDGAVFEGEVHRLGDTLNIDESTDMIFSLFQQLTKEYIGERFQDISQDAAVKRMELGRETVLSSQDYQSDYETTDEAKVKADAEREYHQFMAKMAGKDKPGFLMEENGKSIYSFETYLRNKGVGEQKIKLWGRHVGSSQFLEGQQKIYERKKYQHYLKAIMGTGQVILIIALFISLVVVLLSWIIIGRAVWSLSYIGWVLGLSFLFMSGVVVYKSMKAPKKKMEVRFFDKISPDQ